MSTVQPGYDAESPTEIPKAGWWGIALRVKKQFAEDHVTLMSAGVAFFGFTAIAPLLAALVSIYGLLADPSDITSIVDAVRSGAPVEVANIVEQQLETVTSSSTSALGIATAVSTVLALWAASSAMSNLMTAINVAYDEDTDRRPFWKKRALAIAFTLGFIGFTVSSIVAVQLFSGWLLPIAVILIAAGTLAGLAVLYRFAPDRDDARWRWVSPGALLALIGWLAVSFGFRFYVSRFGSYNETYGALGSVVVVLTWLYLSAVVVIAGAELNSETERQTTRDSTVGPAKPMGQRGAHAADNLPETSENR